MLWQTIFLIASYLVGAFPFMLLVSKAKGVDLSGEVDYHIATYRKVGRLLGVASIALDFFKGMIVVLAGYLFGFPLIVNAGAGILATMGQMWPVFQKFNGEKGNTTGGGTAFMIVVLYHCWWVLIIGIIIMATGFLVRTIPRFLAKGQTVNDKFAFAGPPSNSLPLGMLLAFAACPLVSWLSDQAIEITIALLVIFVLIVIRRMTAGVRKDIRSGKSSTGRILLNRFLFDRSFY
jgi:glycerol-3-phosphate acyltransferase PlsY